MKKKKKKKHRWFVQSAAQFLFSNFGNNTFYLSFVSGEYIKLFVSVSVNQCNSSILVRLVLFDLLAGLCVINFKFKRKYALKQLKLL